jgi:hypothetical protein
MDEIQGVAVIVGFLVMGVVAVGATLFLSVAIWVFFPARFQFSRDLPSHLSTPYGPLRLTALVGVGSRRKARWFFGLMLLKEGEAPRSRVVAKKPPPPASSTKVTP